MKKLFKLIVLLVILLAGGIGGGTYWFGMQLESDYQAALKKISSQSGLIIKSTGFTKGLLKSEARAMVMLPGVHVTGTITQQISPGPLALTNLMQGQLDFEPIKYASSGSLKLNAKKSLKATDKVAINRLPAVQISVRSGLLSEKNVITVDVPAFKGKVDGTSMSWPKSVFRFESNSQWNPIHLISGTTNLKLPARVIENLIRLRIHLDIEELKTRRKLKPAEIKKLTPAAVRISVNNALPGYIERYGIKNVLDNAKASNKPINVSFRPGQIKVGGVTLPR